MLSYCNILDAIMELYYSHFDFFHYTAPDKNPYLAFAFYSIVLETVEKHTKRMERQSRLKYSPKRIAGFLCYGIIGFINEGHAERIPWKGSKKRPRSFSWAFYGPECSYSFRKTVEKRAKVRYNSMVSQERAEDVCGIRGKAAGV